MTTVGSLGEFSPPKPADGYIQKICDEVRTDTEKKVLHGGEHFAEFEAMLYREKSIFQYAVGFSYLIKVFTGATKYVHIRVDCFVVPQGAISLVNAQYPKTRNDPLEPID